jgi:phosphosulfolactate phosphohydrolase-like enzyme
MAGKRTVRIDSLPESAWRYSGYDAIVCVDVLLSATTVVTAVAQGRRVKLAPDAVRAREVAAGLKEPLVLTDALSSADDAARFGGPAVVAADGTTQPLVHVSPLATMLAAAAGHARVYIACLRNLQATADDVEQQHRRVVLIGAGENGEVCAADQMATAWLGLRMKTNGWELEGRQTIDEVSRWASSDVSLVGLSRSAERLRARGRDSELAFVLSHVNDLDVACGYEHGEAFDPVVRRRKLEEEVPTPAWGTPGFRGASGR